LKIEDVIRERGPLTVAAFMDLALYDPESGYYTRTARRSGRGGDFFTSVDVGALFGRLLATQVAEMAGLLATSSELHGTGPSPASLAPFDLVEAGAGNGRLAADILNEVRRRYPDVYARTRLHLVERSAAARAAHPATLAACSDRLTSSSAELPPSFDGVLVANELLDAMPVHQIVMRNEGLREVYVVTAGGRDDDEAARSAHAASLSTREGEPSTPRLADYLRSLDVRLEPGWRVEIGLRALDWMCDAARRLRRGFMILIDYGHEARELYSVTHAAGTLTTYAGHTAAGAESPTPPWLLNPGEQDITAHVDFTSIRKAAEAEGLVTLGFLDQTYFLMGILGSVNPANLVNLDLKTRLALKTLLMPGGLGSTMKVLILGKGVGRPALSGCSYRVRLT
jgi:SAM-dependent MidA family methyltransferase